jgi:hypothetical protein
MAHDADLILVADALLAARPNKSVQRASEARVLLSVPAGLDTDS